MGDEDTFTAFVHANEAALLRFAVALVGDRHLAEDLLQNTLERVFGRWGKIHGRGDPEWYVRRSLVNGARDLWRRRKRQPEVFELPEAELGYLPIDEVHTRHLVRAALASLPRRQRMVLVLRYWVGHTEAETAELMGTSVGTVKSQAHRALRTLKEQLSADEAQLAAPIGELR